MCTVILYLSRFLMSPSAGHVALLEPTASDLNGGAKPSDVINPVCSHTPTGAVCSVSVSVGISGWFELDLELWYRCRCAAFATHPLFSFGGRRWQEGGTPEVPLGASVTGSPPRWFELV